MIFGPIYDCWYKGLTMPDLVECVDSLLHSLLGYSFINVGTSGDVSHKHHAVSLVGEVSNQLGLFVARYIRYMLMMAVAIYVCTVYTKH